MPLVQIVVNPIACGPDADSFCTRSNLSVFGKKVQEFVAGALTCDNPKGTLSDDDIEVVIRKRNEGCLEIGGEKFGIKVIVWATGYPERVIDLPVRKRKINTQIKETLPPGIKFYVWILPIGHAEFSVLQS